MTIIRRMRTACWITKAKDTYSEYVIVISFPLQQWLRERASMEGSMHFPPTAFPDTCILYRRLIVGHSARPHNTAGKDTRSFTHL
jgi:hypothetical protein